MSEEKSLIKRVGELSPAERPGGKPLHRPLLLLWAVGQVWKRQTREHRWSTVRDELGKLLNDFAGVTTPRQAALYPFWALQTSGLWEVSGAEELSLTSERRRPTLAALDSADPLAGLPQQDYDALSREPALTAQVASILLVKFFNPLPAGLLEALGLNELMAGCVDTALHPQLGERFDHRTAIQNAYGGNGVMGITPLADGILTVYSDDKGPYTDARVPDTDWIAYTGDGLSGDQKLTHGNKNMRLYQQQQRALRYWHKPYGGRFSFESWAVIVQCRRRWGIGEDKLWRREYVWVLAPVPSPIKATWPHEVWDALTEDTGDIHDDSLDVIPNEIVDEALSKAERYRQLSEAAERTSARRQDRSKQATVERYLRSKAARDAVILRSGGRCENPTCLGHPDELTDAGAPLLQIDHVNDLARGGPDVPEFMIALCPNCHALKTHGRNRRGLTALLLETAQVLHSVFETSEQ
ncbi:HNH endonuclease [Streptomyces sp. LN590]|uniref:HNH endonuclease n=1 Tax=Streptomyces sp. LN590 TaxID=3112980 RepID=UPI003713134D